MESNDLKRSTAAPAERSEAPGRAPLTFADPADIEEFVATLARFESGQIGANEWRAFRLLRGVYGQRQDDVQMFRVKVPQGILTAPALHALADVAETWSRGFGHITTRQNIQFHFVRLSDTEACMRRLEKAGVTTREACGNSVRNIVGCPYAGVCSGEAFDVTPYAEALTRYFLRHRLSSSLPRKFKIAFGGCEPDCAMGAIHDLGFRAKIGPGGERGFEVRVGGGTSTMCTSGPVLHAFLPAAEILDTAEAVLRIFHAEGDRKNRHKNRMKVLMKKMGWEAWHQRYLAELAKWKAEGGARLPWAPEAPPVEGAPEHARPPAPSEQEIASRVALAKVRGPGIVPELVQLPRRAGAFDAWARTNVRQQRQPGFRAVTIHVPMGDLTGAQFRVLAELALSFSDGTLRTTQQQNVVLRWVPDAWLAELHGRLVAAGLGRADANTIADVTSCPGAESCKLAVTQSRGLGRELTRLFESRPDLVATASDASIKISGCPNGCGQHHISTLGFQGGVRRVGDAVIPQYHLLVGGGFEADGGAHFGHRSVKIPARRVIAAVERLLGHYRSTKAEGESFEAFLRRTPLEEIERLLADLVELTAESARPEDYVDIAEDHAFKVETSEGECAA
jgi:sulfite reductase (NADPH) hemoprotein beta-component